jgi:TolB-like protein
MVNGLGNPGLTRRNQHDSFSSFKKRRSSDRADRGKEYRRFAFQNLSDDKANTYFAEGIQDEILTRLSKIADLKVISHTSTERYKSQDENVREITGSSG